MFWTGFLVGFVGSRQAGSSRHPLDKLPLGNGRD
jgi:hypothetical protein